MNKKDGREQEEAFSIKEKNYRTSFENYHRIMIVIDS